MTATEIHRPSDQVEQRSEGVYLYRTIDLQLTRDLDGHPCMLLAVHGSGQAKLLASFGIWDPRIMELLTAWANDYKAGTYAHPRISGSDVIFMDDGWSFIITKTIPPRRGRLE